MHPAKQKDAITTPGLALLTLRYQLKWWGAFSSRFFQQTVFRSRAPPQLPPWTPFCCTEKSITQHFFPRVKHALTRTLCVCVWDAHSRAMHWVAIEREFFFFFISCQYSRCERELKSARDGRVPGLPVRAFLIRHALLLKGLRKMLALVLCASLMIKFSF